MHSYSIPATCRGAIPPRDIKLCRKIRDELGSRATSSARSRSRRKYIFRCNVTPPYYEEEQRGNCQLTVINSTGQAPWSNRTRVRPPAALPSAAINSGARYPRNVFASLSDESDGKIVGPGGIVTSDYFVAPRVARIYKNSHIEREVRGRWNIVYSAKDALINSKRSVD